MDAIELQHIRETWQQILRDALPEEQKVRVGAVGFDGDFVSATVSLRTGRVSLGLSVLVEDANSPLSVAYAFDQAVGAAGYAGIVKVRLPAGEILPPVDPNAQAEADAKAALAVADATADGFPTIPPLDLFGESPAVVDTADAKEETPRRRRKS